MSSLLHCSSKSKLSPVSHIIKVANPSIADTLQIIMRIFKPVIWSNSGFGCHYSWFNIWSYLQMLDRQYWHNERFPFAPRGSIDICWVFSIWQRLLDLCSTFWLHNYQNFGKGNNSNWLISLIPPSLIWQSSNFSVMSTSHITFNTNKNYFSSWFFPNAIILIPLLQWLSIYFTMV